MAITLNETYKGIPSWEAVVEALASDGLNLFISGKLQSAAAATVEFTIGLNLVELARDFEKFGVGESDQQDIVAELLAGEMQMVRFQNRVDFPNAEVIDLAWTVQ